MRPVFLLCFLLIREGISMLDILGIREIYLPPPKKKINILYLFWKYLSIMYGRQLGLVAWYSSQENALSTVSPILQSIPHCVQ